jgi:hypothetical protein
MRALVAVIAFAACGGPKKAAPATTPDAPPDVGAGAGAAVDAAPATPGRFDCAADGDCLSSCALGAVNKAWYEAKLPWGETCQDGCANAAMGAPRCEQGTCVAYQRDGKRADDCTRRDAALPPSAPGPWDCQADHHCHVSCKYGAVNDVWFSMHGKDECRDGCAEVVAAARCVDGGCVAFRADGTREEQCTRVPVR